MITRSPVSVVITTFLSLGPLLSQTTMSNARAMYFAGLEMAEGKNQPSARTASSKSGAKAPSRPGSRIEINQVSESQTGHSNFGVRYSVLKVAGLNTVEVPPQTRFRQGDRIQLKVQVNTNGYLYLVHQGSSGAWSLMYPAPRTERSANRVVAGKEYVVPDAVLRFDAKPGTEKLFLIVSREPEATLDKLIYGRRPGAPHTPGGDALAADLGIDNAVITRLRDAYSREFVREVIEEQASSAVEHAMYVVNTTNRQDSRVVADIALVHR